METTELSHLHVDCVAHIVSLTTPRHACRCTNVSRFFRSIADSDAVWDAFLPPDIHAIVARSDAETQMQLAAVPSRKQLFMRLADSPILIDGDRKSFFLDKSSGKKCFMIAAREMSIIWSINTPEYWKWTPLPESRFAEVAELHQVWWLEISARIETSLLSPKTTYTSYLVFKLKANSSGFNNVPVETSVGITGGVKDSRRIFLTPYNRPFRIVPSPMRFSSFGRRLRRARPAAEETAEGSLSSGARDVLYSKYREEGWMEAELGDCFLDGDDGGELEVSVKETEHGHCKWGLVVQGIEFRPKA